MARYGVTGQDERGITCIEGAWDAPPLTFIVVSGVVSLLLGGFSLFNLGQWLLGHRHATSLPEIYIPTINSIVFGGVSFHLFRLRQRILPLITAYEVRSRLHIDKATLEQYVQAKHLRPLYNINGQDFYSLDALNLPDSDSLVRASEEPKQEPEATLLRAATADVERHEEQLLRAARGPE